jgi:fimbrial chaperone protein
MVSGRKTAALAWLIAALGLAQPAGAGSYTVNPVQISLPEDERAASLTIKNSDSAPVSIHVQTLAWSQVDGQDRYAPTNNLIASPPIFTIAPGASQLLRVGVKDRRLGRAYRVILEEIPPQKPPQGKVQVTLRLNLPLYLLPPGAGKADVSWRAWRDQTGQLFVEGRNAGTLHKQVTELDVVHGASNEVLTKQMGVVLPGSARVWKVQDGKKLQSSAPFILQVRSPTGDAQARITLEPR